MNNEQINIDWEYHGKPDALMGNGATLWEQVLVYAASTAGVLLFGYFYLNQTWDWPWWGYLVAGVIAADIFGGVVANALSTCKRFYHAPLKENEVGLTYRLKNPYIFSALHIYPLLVALLYPPGDWIFGGVWYAMLIASTVIVLRLPLYLQRPMAFLLITTAIAINLYFIDPVPGFEWLVPLLFIKIVYGHLVREEPYRPQTEPGV
jgi:hypothetical protein